MSKVRKRKHGKMPDARQDVNCYHGFAMGRTITPTGEQRESKTAEDLEVDRMSMSGGTRGAGGWGEHTF